MNSGISVAREEVRLTSGDDSPISELFKRIKARTPPYFDNLGPIKKLSVTRSVQRVLSEMHFLLCEFEGDIGRKLVLKISHTAEAEFSAMNVIWPNFETHESWRIPRPLDYFAEYSAVLMEHVSGTPFVDCLPWALWRERHIRNVESDCARVGQWLRYYHQIGKSPEPAPLNADGNWPGLEATLRELSAAGFRNSVYPMLQTILVPLTRRAVTNVRPAAYVHGDFTVDNVLLSPTQVTVVDLSSGIKNAIDLDIASFLNSLMWLRLTRIVPWDAIARMRRAFLLGYFQSDPIDPVTMTFLQGMGVADVALEIVKRRPSKIVHFWVERNCMAALRMIAGQIRRYS